MLWLLSSRVLPPIGTVIPFYIAFIKLKLIDTHIGLIIVFLTFNISLVIWLMKVFFDQIPKELDEAAMIDGCTVFSAFLKVVIPLSTPGLATTSIFCFLFSWNNFLYPLILTRRVAATVPLALTTFLGSYKIDWGAIMAGTTLLILPLLIFALLVNRYLVQGLTQGAMKG